MTRAKVYPPGSPADVFGTDKASRPTPKGEKGFLMRCVEIIIQDIQDKLYADRKRKREEYEKFRDLCGPRKPGNGAE